jgi:hypothetical protein
MRGEWHCAVAEAMAWKEGNEKGVQDAAVPVLKGGNGGEENEGVWFGVPQWAARKGEGPGATGRRWAGWQ